MPRLALVQEGVHVCLGHAQRGHHAHHQPGQQSDGEGIEEDAPIEVEHKLNRQIRVQIEITERAAGAHAKHDAQAAAEQRQHHAFGDHLTR